MWRDSANLAWGPEPFSASFNSINANGIIQQINTARSMSLRLMLALSTGLRYLTDGNFDFEKWKRRIDTFDQPEIKAAVAAGVADGTIIGNAVLDEPNTKRWGKGLDKAVLDRMCTYVKSIFPTLIQGAAVVHWWRPTERYQACDFIIDQWAWWQGPSGPGPGAYEGDIIAWREAGLAQAKKDGVAIAFGLNMLNGGIQSWKTKTCPVPPTGGNGTRVPACRMSPDQIREWGLTLGPAGCAMFMWWYEPSFMSKSENVQALKDIAARLAPGPTRSCRRPG